MHLLLQLNAALQICLLIFFVLVSVHLCIVKVASKCGGAVYISEDMIPGKGLWLYLVAVPRYYRARDGGVSTSTCTVERIHVQRWWPHQAPCAPMATSGGDHYFYPHLIPFAATGARSSVTQKRTTVSLEPLLGFPVNDGGGSGRRRRGKPLKP
jgi:hypothetical protein